MATTISRLGRTSAIVDEGQKRSRCPSKRRGRRPSLRSSVGPEVDVIPKNLMSSVDDEGQSDEEEALLFRKDRGSNSKSSYGTDRRGVKHVKAPGDRQTVRKAHSTDGVLQSPQAASPSQLRGSGTRCSLNTDEVRSPKSRGLTSPKPDGTRSPKVRATRSTSPTTGSSRRGARTSHGASAEAKGRASRHNRGGKAHPPQKLKPATLDDSDSDDDGMPLSYLGGIHAQQGHLTSSLDYDVDFASDYSSATEDETSTRDGEDGAPRERRRRGSSRRQRRSSHSGGMRQASIRNMLPSDDSEFETANVDEEEKDEKRERRKKRHSSTKQSSGQRARYPKGSQPDALQFSPSNQCASYTGGVSETRRHDSMLPGKDDTETEVDETENAADDEQNTPGTNRRQRTRLSMDVLRADILHKQRSESEGKKPTVDDKRIEADMAHAMQRLEAHDAEASKKKKKRFSQLLGMFKKSDTSESEYDSTASTSSARDPSRGLARNRSRLVKNVLPHALLDDSDSEHQEVDLFLATK